MANNLAEYVGKSLVIRNVEIIALKKENAELKAYIKSITCSNCNDVVGSKKYGSIHACKDCERMICFYCYNDNGPECDTCYYTCSCGKKMDTDCYSCRKMICETCDDDHKC